MDFKRSPRLLLFPFLSFSFFYYYFRGARSGWLRPRNPPLPPSSHSNSLTPCFFLCFSSVCLYLYLRWTWLEFVYVLVASQVELGWVWVGLDAWKPWTTLGRLVGFPPRLSARIEAHRHGSNVGTTAAA